VDHGLAAAIRDPDHASGKDLNLHFPVEHLDRKSKFSIVENRGALTDCYDDTEFGDI